MEKTNRTEYFRSICGSSCHYPSRRISNWCLSCRWTNSLLFKWNISQEISCKINEINDYCFFAQVVLAYHVCVCYHCFDSLLCILNLHTASQFRILQYRFANTCNEKCKDEVSSLRSSHEYAKLKTYIQQHQALIEYCKKLEEVFNSMIFGQVLLFSLLMCLDGYLILMVGILIVENIPCTFLFYSLLNYTFENSYIRPNNIFLIDLMSCHDRRKIPLLEDASLSRFI